MRKKERRSSKLEKITKIKSQKGKQRYEKKIEEKREKGKEMKGRDIQYNIIYLF